MKKIFFLVIFILNFSNLLAIESKIIYKIQNQIITNVDIKNEYNYLLALNNNLKSLPKERLFDIAKNSIIREKIKKVELIRNSIQIDSEIPYLNELIKNIYLAQNLTSVDGFKKHLKNYNLEFDAVEEKIRIDALWNVLIIRKYRLETAQNVKKSFVIRVQIFFISMIEKW